MKLTVDDIADQRAYEREREEFRARIIDLGLLLEATTERELEEAGRRLAAI